MAASILPPPPATKEDVTGTFLLDELETPPEGYRWVLCPSCEEWHLRPGTMREALPTRQSRPVVAAVQDQDPSKRDTVPVSGPIKPDFKALAPNRRNRRRR